MSRVKVTHVGGDREGTGRGGGSVRWLLEVEQHQSYCTVMAVTAGWLAS